MSPEFIQKTYGPPGTGKTTWLIDRVEEEVRLGVPPERIAFVAFGHDAIRDARRRALGVVNRLTPGSDDLPYFRTFHALAWRLLGLRDLKRVQVMPEHRRVFCDHYRLGYDSEYENLIRGGASADELLDARMPFGNLVFHVETWLTNNLLPVKDWRRAPIVWDGPLDDMPVMVDRWRAYKAKCGRLDYADVLEQCRRERPPYEPIVSLFDEFQDVSPLQYALYEQWRDQSERVYMAGDDDQTIYTFQGARHAIFLHTPATDEIVLDRTHRMGDELRRFGGLIIQRVAERHEKNVCSCTDPKCEARRAAVGQRVVVLERPPLDTVLRHVDQDDTLILARTNALTKRIRGLLIQNGVPFHGLRGPDDASATWTRGLIAAKHMHDLLRGERLPYSRVVSILDQVEVRNAATMRGFVTREKRSEFKSLPQHLASSWPKSPLGEDLSMWTLGMLRPFLARVPRVDELADAFHCENRRGILDEHVRRNAAWPITPTTGIRVGTVHASKGQEARVVVLLADMSKRGMQRVYANQDDHDAEHRLFYVGATRAMSRLVIASPMFTDATFPLPTGAIA